jgi:hypothetical protein
MKQLTQEQAIRFADSKEYENWTPNQIVDFQLFQKQLCMPFPVFHEALEKVLKRPVFTHEFAFADELRKEYRGDKPAPTLDEIINLIPEEKRVIIFADSK